MTLDSTQLTRGLNSAISSAATKTTVAGSGMSVGGWVVNSDFAAIAGVVLAFAGFVVNWYYQHRMLKAELRLKAEQAERERAEHAARMGLYQ